MSALILSAIFLPIIGGLLNIVLPIKNRKVMLGISLISALLTTGIAWFLLLNRPQDPFVLFEFVNKYTISFRIDGLSSVFVGLISTLWPLATLYSFEYMEHEASDNTIKEKTFFGMYIITFGVTMGIATAENMLTMYVFYEMLTLVTVPLILFNLTKEAVNATRKYITYSLGGAAFAFIGLIFLMHYGDSITFINGGVINPGKVGDKLNVLRLIYVFAFFGFGVKAAIFPLCSWLPKAGVAPTPVTALLHAVAVVKSGAFAIMRLTYYSFGTDILAGTFAQYVPMAFAIFTIVFGCAMAVKERHLKRRLAYSTISNLSYILFAATLMTPMGFTGAMSHMVFHGFMKICSFFCAGAVIAKAHKTYVYELDGIAKRMPMVMAIFTISALALMGVPGLCGFISKYNIITAAVDLGGVLPILGVGALMLSALLTSIYMLQIVVRAYFPTEHATSYGEKCDPTFRMLLPLSIFAVVIIYFGLFSGQIVSYFNAVSGGLF